MNTQKNDINAELERRFTDVLAEKLPKALPTIVDASFKPVIYPAGFNYGLTYGANAYYNPASLSTLNSTLEFAPSGDAGISVQKLSDLYISVLQNSVYAFSNATQKRLSELDNEAESQIASVLRAFENSNFKYSDPLPPGGKIADVFNQLTALYGPITENCDNLPITLSSLRDAISTYIEASGQAYNLHSRAAQATAALKAAIQNAKTPSSKNGGMQTGDDAYYVGFDKLPSANQLIGSLKTDSNAFTVSISGDSFSEEGCDVYVESKAKIPIPIGCLLEIQVEHSSVVNISDYTSTETSFSMKITYPGVTALSVLPLSLSSDNKTGWYSVNILEEIKNKTGDPNADGYKLQGGEFSTGELFGKTGRLNYFKTLIVSQTPSVEVTFNKIDVSEFTKYVHTDNNVKIKLFDFIPLGDVDHSYTLNDVDFNESEQSVTMKFGSPEISGSIPLEQQVAYVLGGSPEYVD